MVWIDTSRDSGRTTDGEKDVRQGQTLSRVKGGIDVWFDFSKNLELGGILIRK